MQTHAEAVPTNGGSNTMTSFSTTIESVRKRDGITLQAFDLAKLQKAIRSAWVSSNGPLDDKVMGAVVKTVLNSLTSNTVDVEVIQDAVETALMRHGKFKVAKAYILYRHQRQELRLMRAKAIDPKGLSDYIHASKYARYIPELKRREVYEETVARVEEMHLKRFPDMVPEIREAFDFVREKRVLPSMRSMQFGGKAVLANNNRIYNCTFSHIDRYGAFSEALYLLLSGCGVGYSVQFDHVEKLPPVGYIDQKKVVHHVVEDSIAGWADALKALLQSYQNGTNLEFSFYKIRPAGAPLKTSGGRAPGHLKLKESLERIRSVLSAAQGRKLRPIECHKILCYSADAVLSGGIRRSAMICLFSLDDSEMMYAKTGNWYADNPWFANANNSVVLKRDEIKKKQFRRIFQMTKEWGEPGFFFTSNYDYGTNPCFHPDSRLWTSDGYVRIGELYQRGTQNEVVADCRAGKGDLVDLSLKGVQSHKATAVSLTQKDAEIFELVTEHGYRLRITAQHKFPTPDGRKELCNLNVGDTLFLPSGEGTFGKEGTAEEGFILGAFVGDGTGVYKDEEAFIDLWEQDFGMLDEVKGIVNEIVTKVPTNSVRIKDYGPIDWMSLTPTEGGIQVKRIGGVRLYRWLKTKVEVEVKSLKDRVPEAVWKGSRDFVAGYLRGLFLTDGTVLLGGKGLKATLSLRLGQSNKELLEDVQVLLSMFGVVSRIYSRRPAGYRTLPDGNGGRKEYWCKENFELTISRPNIITFRDRVGLLGWKKDLMDTYLSQRGESCHKPERFITRVLGIQSVGKSDVYCLTQPETNVVTANGIVTGQCGEIGLFPVLTIDEAIKAELEERKISVEVGAVYTGWAFCNLCEMNAAKFTSYEDFEAAAKAATLIGTLQATYTEMTYIGWVSEYLAKRDALLGVGMTGMMDSPDISCNPEYQKKIAAKVKEWNTAYAARLGIRPAARTTCIKPSGTTSLELNCVGSGHHAHHARRYIRRVTADELEPVFKAFKMVNPHMCIRKPDGKWVIEFPVEAPAKAVIKDDLSALKFLDMVKSTQQNWVLTGTADETVAPGLNHNVSNTITVHPNEWEDVLDYLWAHREFFTGVTLLSASADKDFAFVPNEAITNAADEQRWNDILLKYKPLDYTSLTEDEDGTHVSMEPACAGGVCSLV